MNDDWLTITDPTLLFKQWFTQAQAREPRVPEAMQLASVSASGRPSLRTVLLKELVAGQLLFYTNVNSRKARQLLANRAAAVCFHWKSLERQVIVEGEVQPVTDQQADAYFASRPRGSQLGAWASEQSQPLANSELLKNRFDQAAKRFANQPVPRPPHWHGFALQPERWEFWQGQDSRLHQRLAFTASSQDEKTGWQTQLLYP
jgi:pyridoxamine 5'-phosphate oxidase